MQEENESLRKLEIGKYKKYKRPHKVWKLLSGESFRSLSILFTQKVPFSGKKGWFKGKNSKEFSCRKILNSRAENVIAPPKTLLP